MKKTLTLFLALALVSSLFAVPHNPKHFMQGRSKVVRMATQASTFSFQSSIPAGWTVNPTPAGYETKELARGMQITATTTITYAGAKDVSSVTVTGSTNGDGNTISVKVGTTDFGSVSQTKGDRHNEYKFSGTKSSGNVVITVTQAAKSIWIESISLDGTGGGGGGGTDTIQITSINYGDAYYYEYEEDYYWDIDLYNDYDYDEEAYVYPEFYVSIAANSKTAIAGDCDLYYAGLWTSEKDSVEMADGWLTITYSGNEGVYSFEGEFKDESGKVYVLNVSGVEVSAYDADNDYEEIELNEQGGGGGSTYSFDFTKGQQNWTINDVELPTDLSFIWAQSSTYGMKGTAYYKQAYAAESWLVSPNIDLTEFTEATLKVNHAINKGANTTLRTKISTNGGSTWTDLALNLPEGTSWDFQTDQVSLNDYVGNTVQIAFVYISTTSICPTWEIKKVDITTGGAGGDTIVIKDVDGLEIDYYPSYSEVGAYDYTFLLYNSEDEDYLPMVALDILTKEEKSYTGTYSFQNGTLTDYSYYVYGSGDEDYFNFTDGEITITDNGEGNYTIKGWFTDGDDIYSVDVTLDGEYFNAEYPYEPEEATTLNLVITEGEEDNTYVESYGVIDIYLSAAEGDLTLEYVLSSTEKVTAIADGTYPIEASEYDEDGYLVEKDYGYFDAGYYYSSFGVALASNYQTDEAIYYLVGGTVKIETVAGGKKVTLAGITYYGSTINAEYIIGTSALEDVVASRKSEGKYLINNQLLILHNGVRYNTQGQIVK